MKIVVLVKEVPDTWGPRSLNLETGLVERGASETVLDEVCERALEVGLAHADVSSSDVIALMMGPTSAEPTLRKVLAMGAGSAVQVVDDQLAGADLGLTAEVLAAALKRVGFDLVIAGNSSTDGGGGMVAAMLAELLDVPHLTQLRSVEIGDGTVSGQRVGDGVLLDISADLPAVISITEQLPEARFPDFKSTMAAKKKPLERLSLADLELSIDHTETARMIMTAVAARPPRSAGVKIVDDGEGGRQLAGFLVENELV